MSPELVVWLAFTGAALILYVLETAWWGKRLAAARRAERRAERRAGLGVDWGATWLFLSVVFITTNLALFVAVGVLSVAFPEPPQDRDLEDIIVLVILIGGEFFVVLAGACLAVYRKWFS